MAEVRIESAHDFEKALRKFKTQCKREGIFRKIKERRYYIKPSQRRREKRKKKG